MDAQFIEACLPNLTHYTGVENRKEVVEICTATIEGCRDHKIQVFIHFILLVMTILSLCFIMCCIVLCFSPQIYGAQ